MSDREGAVDAAGFTQTRQPGAGTAEASVKIAQRQISVALAAYLSAFRGPWHVSAAAGTYDALHTPEDVAITGYNGDVMEPFLTRDGGYLLFNNRNESPENTNLHWAKRVDDLTFSYLGEIPGVNTEALEAVPSMDREGNLYFVSTRSYEQSRSTIYRTKFVNGTASTPELVEGVSRRKPGWVNFDAEISADGKTLYFVDGYFGSSHQPQSSILAAAVRTGNGFQRLPEQAQLFSNVNRDWLQYAPNVSADELELFLTRVKRIEPSAEPAIFRCSRRRVGDPFSVPQRISAIQGFAEASTLSPDGRSLYYHARVNGRFRLRRVRR